MRYVIICCVFATTVFAVEVERVKLRGLLAESGDRPVAALTDASTNRWKWCAVGDAFEGHRVVAIDTAAGQVKLEGPSGKTVVLTMEKGTLVASAVVTLLPAEDLDWKWIRSEENPMRKAPEGLPAWAIDQWRSSDENFKMAFVNYYRQHGWELKDVVMTEGRTRYSIHPLKNPADPVLTHDERMKNARPASSPTPVIAPPPSDTKNKLRK